MKYRINYQNGRPKGITKDIEEDVWQKAAEHIVNTYAAKVPRIRSEQYSLTFNLDYRTEKMAVDENSMSPQLVKELNERFG